eukprot:GHVT01028790.1.p2 GENE.GHVT01028790.1~~GHVT01028790.1.p2  ORF type:complete len:102 (-),score=22.54 GHVT01028790.1:106-411(-)
MESCRPRTTKETTRIRMEALMTEPNATTFVCRKMEKKTDLFRNNYFTTSTTSSTSSTSSRISRISKIIIPSCSDFPNLFVPIGFDVGAPNEIRVGKENAFL